MNSKTLSGKGYTYVVTRRTIQTETQTKLRVRVRAWKGLVASGDLVMNEYKDYVGADWHLGNEVFCDHIKRIQKHIDQR